MLPKPKWEEAGKVLRKRTSWPVFIWSLTLVLNPSGEAGLLQIIKHLGNTVLST